MGWGDQHHHSSYCLRPGLSILVPGRGLWVALGTCLLFLTPRRVLALVETELRSCMASPKDGEPHA